MKRHDETPVGTGRNLPELKAQLRRAVQARRDAIDPAERRLASAGIRGEVIRLLEASFTPSDNAVGSGQPVLFAYAPFRSEVDLTAVWPWCREAGISVVLPKIIPIGDGRAEDDGDSGGGNDGDAESCADSDEAKADADVGADGEAKADADAYGAQQTNRHVITSAARASSHRYRMQLHQVDRAEDLAPGRWGIPEPKPICPLLPEEEYGRIRAMLVPGLAFDPELGRLGHGGGFYDRFFAACLSVTGGLPLRIAAAFDEQIVERVPVEPHDVRMSIVVTQKRVFS